jgi:hypothetical protein
VTRARTPRYFTNDGALSWYSTREAEGYGYCVLLKIDTTEMYIYHIAITDPTHTKKNNKNKTEKRVLMVTDRYVRIVYVTATGSRPRREEEKKDEEDEEDEEERSLGESLGNSLSHLGDGIITGGQGGAPRLKVSRKETVTSLSSLQNEGRVVTLTSSLAPEQTISACAAIVQDATRLIFMVRNTINGDQKGTLAVWPCGSVVFVCGLVCTICV